MTRTAKFQPKNRREPGAYAFDITPEGFAYYRDLRAHEGQSVEGVETSFCISLESLPPTHRRVKDCKYL
jgi:hypothetical protein